MIRSATIEDFLACYALGRELVQSSPRGYSKLPDKEKCFRVFHRCVTGARQACAFVSCDETHQDCVTGVLLGILETEWHSSERYATDLAFAFERPWDGVALARAFLAWVPPGTRVRMAVSTGDDGMMRTLFRRIGLEPLGGLYGGITPRALPRRAVA